MTDQIFPANLQTDFMVPFTMETGGHYITMLPADWSICTSHDPLPSSCHSENMLRNSSISWNKDLRQHCSLIPRPLSSLIAWSTVLRATKYGAGLGTRLALLKKPVRDPKRQDLLSDISCTNLNPWTKESKTKLYIHVLPSGTLAELLLLSQAIHRIQTDSQGVGLSFLLWEREGGGGRGEGL